MKVIFVPLFFKDSYGFLNGKFIVINTLKTRTITQKLFTIFHEVIHKLTISNNIALDNCLTYIVDFSNNIFIRLLFDKNTKFIFPSFSEYLFEVEGL